MKYNSTNSLIPSEGVRFVKVGQCYDNVVKDFKGSNYVFDFRKLKTEGLLSVEKGLGKKTVEIASEYSQKSWAEQIGIAVEASAKFGTLKAAASYSLSMASATAANRFNLTAVVTNFEIGRKLEIINYLTNREKLMDCMNPTIAADLNDMVGEKNIAKKYKKYLDFIERYGHGCVVQTMLIGGCFMELSFDMTDSSSASSFQHDAKVGVKSSGGLDLNMAGQWAGQREEECGFQDYKFTQVIIPIGNPLETWVNQMKAAIDEDIENTKKKTGKKATIPDSPWTPTFIDIKPFTKEELAEEKEKRAETFIDKGKEDINNGNLFEAYRTLLMAKKLKVKEEEVEAQLQACETQINEEFSGIDKNIGEGQKLDDDEVIFLDNYREFNAKAKSATIQLLKDYDTIQSIPDQIAEGMIEEELLIDVIMTIEDLEKRFPDSKYLGEEKREAMDLADVKYEEIKDTTAKQATISDDDRFEAIYYLERYKTIKPTEKEEEINQVIQEIKAIPPDRENLERKRTQRKEKQPEPAINDEPQDLTTRYLDEQKKEDGCEKLTTKQYKKSLQEAIETFTLPNVVKEVLTIETKSATTSTPPAIPDSWGQRRATLVSDDDPGQPDYYTYSFEVKTWSELFPAYFEIDFTQSFTGLMIGKLAYYYQTRVEFFQYLFFFVSKSYTDIYDTLYSDYQNRLAYCKKLLDTLLGKEAAITQQDFEHFVGLSYRNVAENPDLKRVYDCFFEHYEFFASAKYGYRIKIMHEGEHYMTDSQLNIVNQYGDIIRHWALTKEDSLENNVRIFPKINLSDNEPNIELAAFYRQAGSMTSGTQNENFYNKIVLGLPTDKSSIYEWKLLSFDLPVIDEKNKNNPFIDLNVKAEVSFVLEDGEVIAGDAVNIQATLSKTGEGLVKKVSTIRGFPLFIS